MIFKLIIFSGNIFISHAIAAVTSIPRRGPTLRRIDKRQLREKMSSVADSTDGQETGFKNRHYFATMGLAFARLRGSKLMPSSSTAETSHLPGYSVGSRSCHHFKYIPFFPPFTFKDKHKYWVVLLTRNHGVSIYCFIREHISSVTKCVTNFLTLSQ